MVVERASGVWVYDVDGRRYMDCLSSYSALNQGHCHPRILQALREQAERVTLTSRAFRNDQLPRFVEELARDVRHGDGAAHEHRGGGRRIGHQGRAPLGIRDASASRTDEAEIIVCENNFHGRTTTITGFSSEPLYRDGFGPFTPGFVTIPFATPKRSKRPSRRAPAPS